jgi:hypothetical protein
MGIDMQQMYCTCINILGYNNVALVVQEVPISTTKDQKHISASTAIRVRQKNYVVSVYY